VTRAQAGKRVDSVEVDGKIRIAAIRRLGSVSVASPSDVLVEGDEINAIVAPDALSQFASAFSAARPDARLTA
jgi:Trk K+ transport system NAD-binding subunit